MVRQVVTIINFCDEAAYKEFQVTERSFKGGRLAGGTDNGDKMVNYYKNSLLLIFYLLPLVFTLHPQKQTANTKKERGPVFRWGLFTVIIKV